MWGPYPVVVTRDMDGELHVFENRCAHRGVEFCREYRGKADSFICPYHNWTYDLKGDLTAIPFRRGVKGLGGAPKDFDMSEFGLRRFHVATRGGVIFATACDDMESIEEYLGPEICAEFDAHVRRDRIQAAGRATGTSCPATGSCIRRT